MEQCLFLSLIKVSEYPHLFSTMKFIFHIYILPSFLSEFPAFYIYILLFPAIKIDVPYLSRFIRTRLEIPSHSCKMATNTSKAKTLQMQITNKMYESWQPLLQDGMQKTRSHSGSILNIFIR